jgi:hypothetical protein
MKIKIKLYLVIFNRFSIFTSCTLEGGESLNGSIISSVSDDLSREDMPQAISGVLFRHEI